MDSLACELGLPKHIELSSLIFSDANPKAMVVMGARGQLNKTQLHFNLTLAAQITNSILPLLESFSAGLMCKSASWGESVLQGQPMSVWWPLVMVTRCT